MTTTIESNRRIFVWDLPTRLFHWSLALCFAGAYITADSERYRDIHVTLGYALLGLVVFRIVWGVIGSRYARFASFPLRPAAVKNYLTSLFSERPEHHVGHNPAGSYAVLALLALAAASSLTGLLTYNDVLGDDPHEIVANLMLALVGIHIAAVVVSSVLHKENLVRAMVTGFKRGRAEDGIPTGRWLPGTALVGAFIAGFAALAQASPKDPLPNGERVVSQHGDRHGAKHGDDDEDD